MEAEQLVSEKLGVGRSPCENWKEQDDGMNVLAAAIYMDYNQASSLDPVPYARWLVSAVKDGLIRGNSLQRTVQTFFSSTHCQ